MLLGIYFLNVYLYTWRYSKTKHFLDTATQAHKHALYQRKQLDVKTEEVLKNLKKVCSMFKVMFIKKYIEFCFECYKKNLSISYTFVNLNTF